MTTLSKKKKTHFFSKHYLREMQISCLSQESNSVFADFIEESSFNFSNSGSGLSN